MNPLDDFQDADDLAINGAEVLQRFIKANYQKLTITQMCELLKVTTGIIGEILTPQQLVNAGRWAASGLLIVRDSKSFEKDYKKDKEYHGESKKT